MLSTWNSFAILKPIIPTKDKSLGEVDRFQSNRSEGSTCDKRPGVNPEPMLDNSSYSTLLEQKENLFNKAFLLPKILSKTSTLEGTRIPVRLPAVATSDEYRAWYEQIESDKQKQGQIRAKKRATRETKKVSVAKSFEN